MASVDDVKGAIEDVVPGRGSRRRRLPVALLIAAFAGFVAWASRLGPVRAAVQSAVSGVRVRVASIRGAGAAAPTDMDRSPAAVTAGSEASSSDSTGSNLTASETATDATAGAESGAAAPVGIGFDDAVGSPVSAETIPGDTEEGRPAGV